MKIEFKGGLFLWIFIIMLVLKLAGVISISWWWVFSPIILAFVLTAVISVIIGYFVFKGFQKYF